MRYVWDWNVVTDNLQLLLDGAVTAVSLSVLSAVIGTALAIPQAMAMLSRRKLIRIPGRLVMETLRALPLLVLLVWVYYGMPAVGVRLSGYWTAVLVFSLSLSGFTADLLRGSAEAVPTGHVEAALVLGLSRRVILWRIIMPELWRRSFPGMVAFYIGTYKLTALASVVGVRELLYTARIITSETPAPLEVYSAVAAFYILTVIPMSIVARRLESHPWFALYPKSV